MTADFLLELLSEEIPARMQDKACEDLARLFAAELARAGIAAAALETHATPRRLALIARGLPLATAAVSEEIKGPRADAPAQALAGFLGKTGLTREQLVERTDAKGNAILFAVIEKPGRATADVLAEAIPAVIRAFPWPKSMRWGAASAGSASLRWVRPLKGIVAILGEDLVPVTVEGIASGYETVGHRFHHPGIITIGGAHDYAEKLHLCHVILDAQERRRIVAEGAAAAASAAGLVLIADEGLVAENAGLTEWPVPLLGRFDPAYLEVPREVIQLTMRTNQKYFACSDPAGALAPAFVCTANIAAVDDGAAIIAGNEKVLAARLSDAKFFWEQDLKIPLEAQAEKLSGIVFHEKLGTIADKVDRVAKLARWLVEEGIVGDEAGRAALADMAERAARLCKADLVTGMVGEFPELQGIIGGHLARAQGEDDAIADAVRDHYKPVGQADDVPTAPVTVAVSLADKLDSFISFFRLQEFPTGSRDPFALRRAVLSIASLLTDNNLRMSISAAVEKVIVSHRPRVFKEALRQEPALLALDLPDTIDEVRVETATDQASGTRVATLIVQGRRYGPFQTGTFDLFFDQMAVWHAAATVDQRIFDFAADRLKVQQREAGVRHDLIDAVFALGGEDDLVRLLARVRALQAFIATEDGVNLLAGYKRAANILRIEEKKDGAAALSGEGAAGEALSYTPEAEEAALIAALAAAEPRAQAAVAAEDFEGAMAALAALRAPIDAFFERVTVNDPDPARRSARLRLLARVRGAVHRVADFSRIEG